MTPILHYRDFWDVPRMFLVRHLDRLVLFDCPFDEELEDYADEYRVYEMPEIAESALGGPWADLPKQALRLLGTVPIGSISFDQTKRKSIAPAPLDELAAASTTGLASGTLTR